MIVTIKWQSSRQMMHKTTLLCKIHTTQVYFLPISILMISDVSRWRRQLIALHLAFLIFVYLKLIYVTESSAIFSNKLCML